MGFQKGNKYGCGQRVGYKHSKETKIKISKTKKEAYIKGKSKGTFKKGIEHPNYGKRPWNYIDGRSKVLGPARYGDDWDKIRYLVYMRDNFMCQDCGKKGERLDVHHIIPFLNSFDNSINNLIVLCRKCHRTREVNLWLGL